MTDEKRIETLLTALETALEIGIENTGWVEGYWGEDSGYETLKQLQEYAKHERDRLNQEKEGKP